jgi:hypothetical protein
MELNEIANNRLTSQQIAKTALNTANNRASHLLLLTELDKIVCSGSVQKG